MQITLLHADHYVDHNGRQLGFESVSFPVTVQAELYRFGDNNEYTIPGLAIVKDCELKRIGYSGPFVGKLSFGKHNSSWREEGPFEFWNRLKRSRPVGSKP